MKTHLIHFSGLLALPGITNRSRRTPMMKALCQTLVIAAALCTTSSAWADGWGTCYSKNSTPYWCWVFDTPGAKTIGGPGVNPWPHRIAVSNVTLDCGWTPLCTTTPCPTRVTEPSDGSGRYGIYVESFGNDILTGITIKRCDVRGWDANIFVNYVNGATIHDNFVQYGTDGIDTNRAWNLNVYYNTARYNAGDGIDVDEVRKSNYHDNWIYSNGHHGITLNNFNAECSQAWRTEGTRVQWNTIYDNGQDMTTPKPGRGVNIEGTKTSTIAENWIWGNRGGAGACKSSECCESSNVICRNKAENGTLLPATAFEGDEPNLPTCR
jgi:hypothetical protein